MEDLLKNLSTELETNITASIKAKLDRSTKAKVDKLEQKLTAALTHTELHVKVDAKAATVVTGLKHARLPLLIMTCANRLPVLLVGMAGTGKTHAAEQVATALDLDFFAMSVGAQTSKSDLMGFIHAGGQYIPSLFRKAYESGGVFLLDEIDAGNSNVLVQLNAALSNGYCGFPDRMVKKHPDFVFVASANTYGQGASRQYVGRNQLDASTLDRFVILDWNIDEALEAALIAGPHAEAWLAVVRKVRGYIESEGIRALVTPRATLKGHALLSAGMDMELALESTILGGIAADKQSYIRELAKTTYAEAEPKAKKPTIGTIKFNGIEGVLDESLRVIGEAPSGPVQPRQGYTLKSGYKFKVGDRVRVIEPDKADKEPARARGSWNKAKAKNVGNIFTIDFIDSYNDATFDGQAGEYYRCEWLELVEAA